MFLDKTIGSLAPVTARLCCSVQWERENRERDQDLSHAWLLVIFLKNKLPTPTCHWNTQENIKKAQDYRTVGTCYPLLSRSCLFWSLWRRLSEATHLLSEWLKLLQTLIKHLQKREARSEKGMRRRDTREPAYFQGLSEPVTKHHIQTLSPCKLGHLVIMDYIQNLSRGMTWLFRWGILLLKPQSANDFSFLSAKSMSVSFFSTFKSK